jgi:stearoyl-CoA desaturase (delta-9 desaturase)
VIQLRWNLALPGYALPSGFNWPLFSVYVLLHLSLLVAPFTFTWPAFLTGCLLSFATICLGITLCYHRLLAHRSYQVPQPIVFGLSLLACLALQRGPLWWVACHRLHHQRADKQGDPHSPVQSFVWSHFLWPFFRHPQLEKTPETLHAFVPDLVKNPGLQFLEQHYTLINTLFLLLLFGLGYAWGGWHVGVSFLVWAGGVRLVYGLNVTWLANSAAHIWGRRRYETPDKSRNNWWVALLTYGEGWHNNHHAHPRAARMGTAWYELDITYYIIVLLHWAGLAKGIVAMNPGRHQVKPAF